jgi:hypothetical protein
MNKRFATRAGLALGAALLGVGVAAPAAVADPPPADGFVLQGYYPSEAACVSAAQAEAPIHGPVYICERYTATLYGLWMH